MCPQKRGPINGIELLSDGSILSRFEFRIYANISQLNGSQTQDITISSPIYRLWPSPAIDELEGHMFHIPGEGIDLIYRSVIKS